MHYDGELIIDYANDSFYAMTGCSPEDVRYRFHNRLSKMILPEDWTQMEQQIESAAAGNGIFKMRVPQWTADALPAGLVLHPGHSVSR
ncbi:MAG: PAS domain-containing protein [Enterocloster sp.]